MINLVKCADCGKKVSINADICPKCGSPIQNQKGIAKAKQKNENEKIKKEKNTKNNLMAIQIGLMFLIGYFAVRSFHYSILGGILLLVSAVLVVSDIRRYILTKYSKLNNKMIIIASCVFGFIGFIVSGSAAKKTNELYLAEHPEVATQLAVQKQQQQEIERQKEIDKKREYETSEVVLLSKCQQAVKLHLKNPRSFDTEKSTVEYGTREDGFAIRFNYYAKNSFGAELLGFADCTFDKNGSYIESVVK